MLVSDEYGSVRFVCCGIPAWGAAHLELICLTLDAEGAGVTNISLEIGQSSLTGTIEYHLEHVKSVVLVCLSHFFGNHIPTDGPGTKRQ